MKIDLKTLITEELSKQRKVFHSEDDLKFSLGYLIKKKYDKCEIRLEKPVEIEMINREGELIKSRAAIDIVIIDGNNNQIPIEIKYKTKSLVKDKIAKEPKPFKVENELYDLSNQGASDLGRFNFRKDIFRIEKFIENGLNKAEYGFCLIITNDKDYWTEAKETLIKNYSLHGPLISEEDFGWNYDGNIDFNKHKIDGKKVIFKSNKDMVHWTSKGDLYLNLKLNRSYAIKWEKFSIIENAENSEFQFCLIEVKK